MRSSESANITQISTWPPKVMRSGNRKNAAIASSHGTASGHWKRCRRTRYAAPRSRASMRAGFLPSLAAIKPRRFDEQHQHGDGVDKKSTGIRVQIFSGGIDNAKHEGRQQRALQAAEAADRDHDQKQHEIDHGETWREAEQLDGEPAAECCQPRADRECKREQTVDVDANRLRHAPVIDRGSDFGADIRLLEDVPEHGNEKETDRDEKGAITRERAEAETDVAFEPMRQRHRFRDRPVEVSEGRD